MFAFFIIHFFRFLKIDTCGSPRFPSFHSLLSHFLLSWTTTLGEPDFSSKCFKTCNDLIIYLHLYWVVPASQLDYCNSLLTDLIFPMLSPPFCTSTPAPPVGITGHITSLTCLSGHSSLSINLNSKFLIVVCVTWGCLVFPIHFLVF